MEEYLLYLSVFFANKQKEEKRVLKDIENMEIFSLRDFISKREKILTQKGIAFTSVYLNLVDEIKKEYGDKTPPQPTPIILPLLYNKEMSLYDAIYSSLEDLVNMNKGLGIRWEKDYARNADILTRNANILKWYFGIDCKAHSLDEILPKVDLNTTSGISAVLDKNICVKSLFKGITENHILINPDFLKRLQSVVELSMYNDKFKELICRESEYDLAKLKLIAEIFNLELIEIEEKDYLIYENEVRSFRDHHRALFQTLKNYVIPLETTLVYEYTKNELNINFCFEKKFINELLIDDFYESIEDENGLVKYQIKWQYLSSFQLKAKRIIYELGGKLQRNEIIKEYRIRSKQNGETSELIGIDNQTSINLNGDIHFRPIGKMYWEYIENPNEQKNKDNAWTEISKIVCKNGGIGTFEFIKSKLVEIGYNYDNTTIKTYISKSEILPAKLNDEKIYVHPDFIYSFPNIVLVKRNTEIGMIVFVSIIKILKTKIDSLEEKEILFNDVNGELDKYELKKIGIQRFDQYIEYLKDYDAISVNNGEKYIISLNLEVANSLDLSKFGKRKEPEYRKNIRALVYDYLLKKSNFICEINELWKEFKEYMPDNISDTQFYKIINNCEFFTKISNGRNSLIQLDLSKIKEQPKAPNEEVEIPVIEEIESVELIDENNSIQKIVVNPATKINTYNTDELISKLREEIKLEYKLSDDIIDKGIANFIDTLYTKNGKSKWADSLLQSIHNIWFNNTRYYDREACLIKLTTNFESYLRISFGLESNRTGLVEVINNIQQLSDLKSYKLITKNISREDINCEKLKFSKIVNTLIWYRNLYSHNSADENLEMGQASHMKNATDFAALYIYTGYLMTI